jgi:hypothetical protein
MHDFIKNFVRTPDGGWLCVELAELKTPQGRIQVAPGTRFERGTIFMGVELARMLDEQAEKDGHRP